MLLTIVEHNNTYHVVNTFDGVIVEQFETYTQAQEFAILNVANEQQRLLVEYEYVIG